LHGRLHRFAFGFGRILIILILVLILILLRSMQESSKGLPYRRLKGHHNQLSPGNRHVEYRYAFPIGQVIDHASGRRSKCHGNGEA